MSNKQGKGGGARKIGNHKKHCEQYEKLGTRIRNKIRHFLMHNIPKDADEKIAKKLFNDFNELQKNRKRR